VQKLEHGIEVEASITNTGDCAGDEVVQLYVDFPNSIIERPAPLLKGFERVSLQPGERKSVRLFVPYGDLKYWDVSTDEWRLEPGRHKIALAPDSTLVQAIWGECLL
jgi:beta-glucosidase